MAHKENPRTLFLLIALSFFTTNCAAVSSPSDKTSRVSVTFVEPEKFTDVRSSKLHHSSAGLLEELKGFMIQAGERILPADQRLDIQVTDVDLAGDFELFRGPQFDDVRITKGLYPPRIDLAFRLMDSAGNVIKEGTRKLTDIDYQQRHPTPQSDYLRYEKELLRDWFRAEFAAATK